MDFKKTFLLGLRLTIILFSLGFLISFNHFQYDNDKDVKIPEIRFIEDEPFSENTLFQPSTKIPYQEKELINYVRPSDG